MMIRISFLVLLSSTSLAYSDIHKCVDEEGNVAYQQTPCPPPVESEPLEPETAVETESLPVTADEPRAKLGPANVEPKTPADVVSCKIPLREAIDEIEAEMLRGYPAEQGEEYKQELRALTQEMRACE